MMKPFLRRTPIFLDSSLWKWLLPILIYFAFSFFLTGTVLLSLEEIVSNGRLTHDPPSGSSFEVTIHLYLIVFLIFMIAMSGADAMMNTDQSRLEKQTWFYRSLPISPNRLILTKSREYLFNLLISGFIFTIIPYFIILKEYPTFSFLHYVSFILAIMGYSLVFSGWLLYYRLAMKHRLLGIYLWFFLYLGFPIILFSVFIRESFITYLLRQIMSGNALIGIGIFLSGLFIFIFWGIYTHHALTKRDLTLS